ncbi:hypothetical protein CRENBAI_015905 [Crenichthys baileyi]|uniref:Uncharacterized protein n=1 Tax=Crenichthys baileyi TaxID=28760 RepID=A0AAV9QSJ7_9TELE
MVDLLICHPEGPLLCSANLQTEGLLLCLADLQTEVPLLCSANLQTVSSFVAGLLHSCSVTAGFLTNLQVPADAGLHGLYISAGLRGFPSAFPPRPPKGLYVLMASLSSPSLPSPATKVSTSMAASTSLPQTAKGSGPLGLPFHRHCRGFHVFRRLKPAPPFFNTVFLVP